MSTSYSATAEFTDSQTVLVDGDAASADNLNAAPKKALDRCAMLRGALDGLLVWRNTARVATGGAASGSTGVYVPPIEAVSLLDGTTWKAFSLGSETQLTTASHFSGGTLAGDTWYYVYASVSGSALALQISADAPDAGLIWKTGATGTHRYLFCFHTDSSGVPLPMRMSGGRYLYRFSAITSTELRALNTASEVTATDVILARGNTAGRELIPAFARVAHVRISLVATGNHVDDQVSVFLTTKPDTTASSIRHDFYIASTSHSDERDGWIETNDSRTIQYALSLSNTDAGDPTATLSLYVLGFET